MKKSTRGLKTQQDVNYNVLQIGLIAFLILIFCSPNTKKRLYKKTNVFKNLCFEISRNKNMCYKAIFQQKANNIPKQAVLNTSFLVLQWPKKKTRKAYDVILL